SPSSYYSFVHYSSLFTHHAPLRLLLSSPTRRSSDPRLLAFDDLDRRTASYREAKKLVGAPESDLGGGTEVTAEIGFEGADELLRSEEHTSELQSLTNLVCRLLLEKKKTH